MRSYLKRVPRLARHTGIYVAVPVLVRALYFGLVPIFTRYLTPEEYGAWGYVSVAATMLGSLAPLGLLTAYNYALRRPGHWPVPADEVRRAALQTAIALTLAVSAVSFWGLRQFRLGLENADLIWLLVLAATLAGSLVQAAKRRYQMLEAPSAYVQVELATGLTLAVASLVLVVGLRLGVLGLALGLAVGAIAGNVASIRSLVPDLTGRVSAAARRVALRFGFPLFVHTAAAIVLQYVDRFMLERMSTLQELGFYSLAGQIGTAMLLITTSTNQAYIPFLYRHRDDPGNVAARGRRYVALFFTGVGLVGIALTVPFMRYFIDARYLPAEQPAQILLAAGIFHGFYFLMVGRLIVAGRMTAIAWATVSAMALNVALNLVWIPRWAALGAAWATCVSEVWLFSAVWYAARRTPAVTPAAQDVDRLDAGG